MTDLSNSRQFPEIGITQIALLERLSNAVSVSGDEGEIRSIVLEEIKALADDLKIDAMGNILVTRKSKAENPLRVMVAAHMDEVGFMLVDDDGDGIYKFEIVGGVDTRQLPGKPVLIGKNNIPGVIGAKPIHFTNAEERKSPVSLENLRIDVGPSGSKKVKLGDRAVLPPVFFKVVPLCLEKH